MVGYSLVLRLDDVVAYLRAGDAKSQENNLDGEDVGDHEPLLVSHPFK